NPDISEKLLNAGLNKNMEIIADSAEPKSIEELKRLGWRINPAKKGPDSIKLSINILKRYPLNITRDSPNLRNELNRYKWKTDRSGRVLNEPVDSCNNLIDPLRYVALNKLKINNLVPPRARFPFREEKFRQTIPVL
ncbi:MAG TPA: terminase large subunit, partial [Mucilaginibacter sp.]|nr:terminase large subunit [Mucilaginibacter sp.]